MLIKEDMDIKDKLKMFSCIYNFYFSDYVYY